MNHDIESRISVPEKTGGSVLKNLRTSAVVYTHALTESLRSWIPRTRKRHAASLAIMALSGTGAAAVAFYAPDTRPALAQTIIDTRVMQSEDGSEAIEASDSGSAMPVSPDIYCVEKGTGRWIVENLDCGPEPIDEERNPGALVAPAVSAAAPVSGSIPHNARYGDNPGLWVFPEPPDMPPRRVHIWGAPGYGEKGDGFAEPSCIYSMIDSNDLRDYYFVAKGQTAPYGAIRSGVIYKGYFKEKGILQDPVKPVGDYSVIFSENKSIQLNGSREWSDMRSTRNPDNSFRQYSFKTDESGFPWIAFGFSENEVRHPVRDAVYVWRFHAPDYDTVIASVSCAVSSNPEHKPVKPKIPYSKWISSNGAPPNK